MPDPKSRQARAVKGGLGAAAIAAVVAAAVTVQAPRTAEREGTEYRAYKDGAGVWTICRGHTTGVHPGMVATPAQCDAWLQEDLKPAIAFALRTTPGIEAQPSALREAGDFVFNAGGGWWLKSPMRAHFLAGRWSAGCEAFQTYIIMHRVPEPIPGRICRKNAAGVPFCESPGLKNRREKEATGCLKELRP